MEPARVSGAGLSETLEALLHAAPAFKEQGLNKAPDRGGAYVLAMHLREPLEILHRGRSHLLEAGSYAYAGSAYGPGGIRARLRRHFRREKKLHWHVDRLTVAAEDIRAIALEGGSECEIVEQLMRSPGFAFPLDGFGSSDCNSCRSHLLQWHRQI
ncbi:MAG: DUF123 domain-containing protein [Novosphingobium sp.]|nr:DUF123 domain-containing protein [Novosphingobium sp.]